MSEPRVIFENKDFVVVDKPAGLMVHPARLSSKRRSAVVREAEPTLVDWLLARYPEIKSVGDDPVFRPGIVHRLDKATSGVMLVAKTQTSFEHLKKIFQEHGMQKTYFAVVWGMPAKKQGIIDAPIGIKTGSLKRSVHSSKMAKEAITEYSVVKAAGEYALLKVSPKTGRTHQIRVHLASIGHPIVGDPLYGRKGGGKGVATKRLMLHAGAIAFSDSNGNRFEFESPLPAQFEV